MTDIEIEQEVHSISMELDRHDIETFKKMLDDI